MPFDPDAYLAGSAPASDFDPDEYLRKKQERPPAFDPDAYLKQGDPGWLAQRKNEFQRGVAVAEGMGATASYMLDQGPKAREQRLGELTLPHQLSYRRMELELGSSGLGVPALAPDEQAKRLENFRQVLLGRQAKRGVTPEMAREQSAARIAEIEADQRESLATIAGAHQVARDIPTSSAMRDFQKAEGVLGTLGAVAKNPVAVPLDLMANSLPAALPGMAAGAAAGTVAGPGGTAAGTFAGAFAPEYLGKVLDVAEEMGVNLTNPEELEAFFNDPEKIGEASRLAVRKGVPIAAIDALTGGLAGKFLKGAFGQGWKKIVTASIKEGGVQAAGGMAGEAAGQLAAGEELSARDIIAEGIAELPSGVAEVGTNVREELRGKPTRTRVAAPPVAQGPAPSQISGPAPDVGNPAAAPLAGVGGAAIPAVDDILGAAAAAQQAEIEARAKQQRERDERQSDAAARRDSLQKHLTRAYQVRMSPNPPTYAEIVGALNALEHYENDNSLGLTLAQRQEVESKARDLRVMKENREKEENGRRAIEAERLAAEQKAADEQRTATVKADQDAVRMIERTGRDPREGGRIVDISRVPPRELEQLARSTDDDIAASGVSSKQIEQELFRREESAERNAAQEIGRDELLAVLSQVKLPSDDDALGGELRLLSEEMTPAQRRRYMTPGRTRGLDSVAEVLRADYGFTDILTPADVIDRVQRALRGEKIRATGQTEFATPKHKTAAGTLSEGERRATWRHFQQAFPELTREVDIELALSDEAYAGSLAARGQNLTPQEAADTEAVFLPAEAQPRRREAESRRDAIIFAARAWQTRKQGSSRAVHEVAHSFWWALPDDTRAALTELHRQELAQRTGPLFDESRPFEERELITDLEHVSELDERGTREWFAERVARLNEAWADGRLEAVGRGRLSRAQLALRDAWEQVVEVMRRVFEAFVRSRGEDPERAFWQQEFRRYMLGGTRADERTDRRAAAYAEGKRAEFAERKRTVDFAEPKENPDDLQRRLDAARIAKANARSEFEGHAADVQRLQRELEEIARSDREDREVAGRHAQAERDAAEKRALAAGKASNQHQFEAERLEQALEREKLSAEGLAASVVPQSTPARRKAALLDVRAKLIERHAREKHEGHDAAGFAVRREQFEVEQMLQREFPGWREELDAPPPTKPGEPPAILDERRPEDGQQDPKQEAPEYPIRAERFDEVEGQSMLEEPLAKRAWAYVRDKLLIGFKGAIPELPTFPAAWWNRSDQFLKGNSTFYNRLREGWRMLKRSTPEVMKTAEEHVARIARPLLDAGRKSGTKFEAEAYARLQFLQDKRRRLQEDGKRMNSEEVAEIRALNSRFENDPYVLFSKLVMYLDFQWRSKNLRNDGEQPITLPGGLNIAEVETRIADLKKKVEAGGWSPVVAKALRDHIALVRQIADDLKARELWPQEALTNPFYFPHIVLGKSPNRLERVRIETAEDFRGYLLDPVGSSKPIETDYTKAMYYHLVQVGAHNRRSDIVRNYFQSYDVMEDVRSTAKRLSRQRGVHVDWRQAFHEEFADQGYVLFSADPGSGLMPALTVDRDKLAHRLGVMIGDGNIQAELEKLGVRGIKILPEDVRESLMAGEKEYWVVPEKVAEAVRGMMQRERQQPGGWAKFLAGMQGLWKGWTLFAPWNYVRYEYGNTLADLEKLFSADPKVFTLLPRAAREVYAFLSGKGTVTAEVRDAFRHGVLSSVTAEEIGALPDLQQFADLATNKQRLWNWIRTHNTTSISRLREATFRYAKFLADLDRLKNGARPVYAGAYWKDIDAIRESKPGANDANVLKAAQVSLATFGDYGDISVGGQELRHKLVPFYSWMEINMKYHANLFRNLRDAVAMGEASAGEAAKAGSRAALVFAAGMGRRAAGMFLARLALPYLAVLAWNHSGDNGDIEDELSEEDKRRFHIVVGRDAEGRAQVIYAPTAFADVMKWFSGPEFARLAVEYTKGNVDLPTALSVWGDRIVPDFINNTVGTLGPLFKAPVMFATEKSFFPDVTEPKNIPAYDFRRAIIASVTDQTTADWIERAINKDYLADKDVGTWLKQAVLQVRARDAEAWAFYSMKDKASDFLERRTGQKRDSNYDAPDQQVLRNFRRSIYRGDVENAVRFYNRLLEYGYTADRFKASIRAQDPLAALPRELRREFVDTLTENDRGQLERAYQFYVRIALYRGDEKRLFPRKGKTTAASEVIRSRFTPRPDLLAEELGGAENLPETEVEARAKRLLATALRPGKN